jgi:hypothetical protein
LLSEAVASLSSSSQDFPSISLSSDPHSLLCAGDEARKSILKHCTYLIVIRIITEMGTNYN